MAKYIIRVEQVGEPKDQEFEDAFGKGIECEGFVILGKRDKAGKWAIHGLSIMHIADAIMANHTMYTAAQLASVVGRTDFLRGDDNDD